MVLLLGPLAGEAESAGGVSLVAEVRGLMAGEGLSEKDALKRVAKGRGIGKSEAYREWQRAQGRGR